ncbi:LLM class flavin-dependent oxidoreductase [Homoserinibacter sp. GY 40078]|uniref:LLM class flavin-dependent oxidoreductase n=1 Tax=Homoserinibacter sp. GY 40078 TaxID=2603275 RepID=UPI0011C8B931|nr:LLM class flavin-dependent oxidoreductase [Homoserinibacter sp. GY 40078]TXK16974.1 LLM class flavin-dependent oxidoreductase [Homoserinibacter sp. GY 40078]
MRIHLQLPVDDAATWAAEADRVGVHGVLVSPAAGLGAISAPPVALATRDARVIVPVVLGEEHPVTLAEELVVLDALSGGRIVALVDTAGLDAEAALEDAALLRHALSGRPIRHRGARWTVPAGIAEDAPDAVIVTPGPVQLELPLWVTGAAASEVGASIGLAVLAEDAQADLAPRGVQPACAALNGDLETDRATVLAWMAAGATHLVLALPDGAAPAMLGDYLARYLIPEAAMVDFPRLMAETTPPPVWPGSLPAVESAP